MSNASMQLINVSKSIRGKKIIDNLNFEIEKGEVFGFIGPNGAGKTTTIRMMVGLMKLSAGDILIQGKSIRTDYKAAIREVGAIVENPEMYPFLSGWDNLKHFANMIPGISDQRIHEVIELVGLKKAVKEKVGRYSLGMRQRLGIAQALLHRPSILILDEPTNGLDPAGIREMREHIRKLAKEENVSVIISSHLLSEIELMCDRIGIIKNGALLSTLSVADHVENSKLGLQEITIEANPVDKVQEILTKDFSIEAKLINGASSFVTEKEVIPKIIKMLVEQDIAIYEVHTKRSTLEDKFLDAIGTNEIL